MSYSCPLNRCCALFYLSRCAGVKRARQRRGPGWRKPKMLLCPYQRKIQTNQWSNVQTRNLATLTIKTRTNGTLPSRWALYVAASDLNDTFGGFFCQFYFLPHIFLLTISANKVNAHVAELKPSPKSTQVFCLSGSPWCFVGSAETAVWPGFPHATLIFRQSKSVDRTLRFSSSWFFCSLSGRPKIHNTRMTKKICGSMQDFTWVFICRLYVGRSKSLSRVLYCAFSCTNLQVRFIAFRENKENIKNFLYQSAVFFFFFFLLLMYI